MTWWLLPIWIVCSVAGWVLGAIIVHYWELYRDARARESALDRAWARLHDDQDGKE